MTDDEPSMELTRMAWPDSSLTFPFDFSFFLKSYTIREYFPDCLDAYLDIVKKTQPEPDERRKAEILLCILRMSR
jgi:hypothetical protein